MNRPARSRTLHAALVYLPLGLGGLGMVFPFWWMFVVSLADPQSAAQAAAGLEGFAFWPRQWRWSNYPAALAAIGSRPWQSFLDALANTVLVATLSAAGQILSCSLVGYGLARLRFRGREPLFVIILATMMLPAQVTMIPLFILFRALGWVDTILPLVVPMFFGTPFFVFLFRQFFAQIPESLVEAARIDGCGWFGIWWRILLPVCRPVIAITAIFTFLSAWNDFLYPLIYLHSEEQMTLAVALNAFQSQYGDLRDVHLLMAASLVTLLPCALLFFAAQRHIIGGLTLGALKG